MGADKRSYTAGHFMMSLDGEPSIITDFDGGNIKAEVATINMGPENVQMKHISTIKYEPFTINIGMSMGKSLYEWIKASLDKQHIRKTGFIAAGSYDYKAQGYRHFQNALITEITLPALDGGSKDPGKFTVKFQPERTEYQKGDDAPLKGSVNAAQKKWLCSNFRLRIGDLDCSKVSKIDAITIKQGVINDAVGEFRDDSWEAASVSFPNLKITAAMSTAQPWIDWHKSFVIDGNCGESDELTGSIEYLSPNGEVLGSFEMFGLGIFSFTQEKLEANKEAISRFTVELYMEHGKLNVG